MNEGLCVNMLTQMQWPWRVKVPDSCGAGVTGDSVPPKMSAGKGTWVLGKNMCLTMEPSFQPPIFKNVLHLLISLFCGCV